MFRNGVENPKVTPQKRSVRCLYYSTAQYCLVLIYISLTVSPIITF